MTQLKILEVLIIIMVSSITSVILELNIIGSNLEKHIKKPNLVYISNALLASLCGFLLALSAMLVTDNIIIWIITSVLGSVLGKKTFTIAINFLLFLLKVIKDTDFSNFLKSDLCDFDDNNKSKNNNFLGLPDGNKKNDTSG